MITPKGEINDKVMELIKDEEILKKMSEAKTAEEVYAVAKEKIDISFEDFNSSLSIAKSFVQESENGELSDDDLEAVAGGNKEDTSGLDAAKNLVDGAANLVTIIFKFFS